MTPPPESGRPFAGERQPPSAVATATGSGAATRTRPSSGPRWKPSGVMTSGAGPVDHSCPASNGTYDQCRPYGRHGECELSREQKRKRINIKYLIQ